MLLKLPKYSDAKEIQAPFLPLEACKKLLEGYRCPKPKNRFKARSNTSDSVIDLQESDSNIFEVLDLMRKRDLTILNNLQRFRCMTRDDIIALHFNDLKNPVTCANTVLKRNIGSPYLRFFQVLNIEQLLNIFTLKQLKKIKMTGEIKINLTGS